MYDAFISYSRLNLPTVQGLKRQCDERRLHVFLDIGSLRAGEDWPPQLGSSVRDSRMMVLCWSAEAQASEWVSAEIKYCHLAKKPVLPWLLDGTPLPPLLQKTHGIQGTDPTKVVNELADRRRQHCRRMAAFLVVGAVLLASVVWFSPQVFFRQSMGFRGHVIDEQGNAVIGATIEADGVRADTNTSGEFAVVLPGPPSRRALRVWAWKPGYRKRTVDTQSDVPDLGVVLEKDR
jgi:hypothetical protein